MQRDIIALTNAVPSQAARKPLGLFGRESDAVWTGHGASVKHLWAGVILYCVRVAAFSDVTEILQGCQEADLAIEARNLAACCHRRKGSIKRLMRETKLRSQIFHGTGQSNRLLLSARVSA
jgi:hypothetical protein